jgi:hypothetical protein
MPGFVELDEHHYLGSINGDRYEDRFGVVVVGSPTSRMLPGCWVELKRWCLIVREPNAGSRQWSGVLQWLRRRRPKATTVVSYSDPSVGHSGGLYRACGWLWAPTWHRLRPPPSGLGSWNGKKRSEPKDRWVYPLMPDVERPAVLSLKDAAIEAMYPWAQYVEPTWRRGVPHGGGGDWKRWMAQR